MSEHWKSTPKYWCKHCSCYIRDTKLERQNHESTARHQGNLKRFLRDLHRGHEKEEREKDRAKQEVARLSGVVGSSSSASTPPLRSTGAHHGKPSAPTEVSLKKQREQLAEMGISMPSEFRAEMAIPGEWQVTNTRVIDDTETLDDTKTEGKANGVRKRDIAEEDKEEEDAIRGLFKKPRRWGRDIKEMPTQDTQDLDALLEGDALLVKKDDEGEHVKDGSPPTLKPKTEPEVKGEPEVKDEPDTEVQGLAAPVKNENPTTDACVKAEDTNDEPKSSGIVFKKRKAKGLRQK
ncbi:uncharacterized protein F5Z01DRAFT_486005 [Emericellopsis atlantica]|uniref:U1-type domain-containing protein n=1 Tax=Emericellopsis atlantica TaxID=2614577 RepID=A0A9P7ZS94_9HYPO|nr:uncharacterized protein F5Z01DRAFT_486005 [Emericellopsis atlantica]KAG9256728.1 hypothetical protein F5Z01DRAFT_486005 [Emericellopsis atlantica]